MMKPLNKTAKNHNLKQSSQLNNSPLKSMFKKTACYTHVHATCIKEGKEELRATRSHFPVKVL